MPITSGSQTVVGSESFTGGLQCASKKMKNEYTIKSLQLF